jgi:hypothetical protein
VLDSQNIYYKLGGEWRDNWWGREIGTSTTCEVSNLKESKSMNEIRSRKILRTGRVLELGTRKVASLLTIGSALVSQQVVEEVAEPLRGFRRGVLI